MQINQRKRYYSLPIPLKYSFNLSIISAALSLLTMFVMAWFLQRNYNLFLGDELGISIQVREMISHEKELLEKSLFLLFLISVTVMFTCSFFIIRKITGPIAALERHLLHLSKGDFSRHFRLRKSDEFKHLESIVNKIPQQVHNKNPDSNPAPLIRTSKARNL